MKNSLKLLLCCVTVAIASPVSAKAPVKRIVAQSDQAKRQRAIEESIGRIQLDHLIASIVDGDAKRPDRSQRAARTIANPVG